MVTPIRNIRVKDETWAAWKRKATAAGFRSRAAWLHALAEQPAAPTEAQIDRLAAARDVSPRFKG